MAKGCRRHAFSLTELLVVIAAILILVSLIFVAGQHLYARSMQTMCASRLEKIGHAFAMYRTGSAGMMPRAWDPHTGRFWYETLYVTHLPHTDALGCPLADGPPPLAHLAGVDGPPQPRLYADPVIKMLRWLKEKQVTEGPYTGRWPMVNVDMFQWPTLFPYYEAISGLSLLAFLGYGCTDSEPAEFADTIRLAVNYLHSVQEPNGMFNDGRSSWPMFTQGICTMAMAVASNVLQDEALRRKARQSAERGLRYIEANHGVQEGDWEVGGFSYDGRPFRYYNPHYTTNPGEFRGYKIETPVTGWSYHGMFTAHNAGISLTEQSWRRAREYTYQATNPFGVTVYCVYPPYDGGRLPGGANAAARAVPILLSVRLLMGQSPGDAEVRKQADVMRDGIWSVATSEAHLMSRGGRDFHSAYFMTTAFHLMGGDYWEEWQDIYPRIILPHLIEAGADEQGNPTAYFDWRTCGTSSIRGGGNRGGDVYSTALGAIIMQIGNREHWLHPEWDPPTGENSYGYNNRLGHNRRTVPAHTIMVMDYDGWVINPDDAEQDPLRGVATRHRGRANALMGDGSVRALYLEDILDSMWSLEHGN